MSWKALIFNANLTYNIYYSSKVWGHFIKDIYTFTLQLCMKLL